MRLGCLFPASLHMCLTPSIPQGLTVHKSVLTHVMHIEYANHLWVSMLLYAFPHVPHSWLPKVSILKGKPFLLSALTQGRVVGRNLLLSSPPASPP